MAGSLVAAAPRDRRRHLAAVDGPPPPVVWQGYAEADFVMLGPTQQGLLTSVFVARGDKVAIRAAAVCPDDADDRAARDQAAQMLAQVGRQLANLEAGAKPTEIEQAEYTWRPPTRSWCALRPI